MRTSILLVAVAASCASGPETRPATEAGKVSTETVRALIRGDYEGALRIADRGLVDHPKDPWLLYDKGAAQAGSGRIDQALDTLRLAEARFSDPHDRSLAAYRRALALELAGRCAEASTEYSHYAALVKNEQPELAADALAHLKFCVPPTAAEEAERQEAVALHQYGYDQELVREAEALSSESVAALANGDYQTALVKARAGLNIIPDDPWLMYNKGTALAGLERTDEALSVLRLAERMFSDANVHGRSVAIYRRAMALEVAGRCDEERDELDRYAQVARPAQPQFVQHTMAHVRFCKLANAAYYRSLY